MAVMYTYKSAKMKFVICLCFRARRVEGQPLIKGHVFASIDHMI